MRFLSKTVPGRGVGRTLAFPTLNFEIPLNFDLSEGVYATRIFFEERELDGVLFFGKRETFDDSLALEVHVLDAEIAAAPAHATLEVFGKIRGVVKFASEEELKKQIAKDCEKARKILKR